MLDEEVCEQCNLVGFKLRTIVGAIYDKDVLQSYIVTFDFS